MSVVPLRHPWLAHLRTASVALLCYACASAPGARPPAEPPQAEKVDVQAPALAPERRGAPSLPPPRPLHAPPPLQFVVLPSARQPILTFRLVFRVGSIDDPVGKEGLTALTAALLHRGGTRELVPAMVLRELFSMAGEIEVTVDKELTTFAGRVHSLHRDRFTALLSEMLVHPRFEPTEFERLRAEALAGARGRGLDDEQLALLGLEALLYEGHPYAHPVGGTVRGLSSITLDDVIAHARRVFTQDRLIVGLAGPVGEKDEQVIRERLAGLPLTGAPAVSLPSPPARAGRVLILRKQTASTAIAMGYAYGLRRDDPDYYLQELGVSCLGQHRMYFGRLFNELREKRALNYGTYAYAEHFRQDGATTFAQTNIARRQQAFSIWIRPVSPPNAMFAARAATYFLAQELQNGIAPDRFDLVRQFLRGQTRLWEQTDQRKLGYAIDELLYNTPGFLDGFRKALASAEKGRVEEVLRRQLDPDRLNFVFVTHDAEGLARLLTEQPPTPPAYPPKASLAEEDPIISSYRLPLQPGQIVIRDAEAFLGE